MTHAVVFSRDRPAQLDMLLRSLAAHASISPRGEPWLERITVLYRATTKAYRDGYRLCASHHKHVAFVEEQDGQFQRQTLEAFQHGDHVMCLCDDDVMFTWLAGQRHYRVPWPAEILDADPTVLCVSLRLGLNTLACYPLRAWQPLPEHTFVDEHHRALRWQWRAASSDFAYPGSLDGNVWRRDDLLTLAESSWDHQLTWSGPNELEDHLHRVTRTALRPHMVCYSQSCIVGLPVNMVNGTHVTNRTAETHRAPLATLNNGYLAGRRLDIASVVTADVGAAHCEFRLEWLPLPTRVAV